MFVDRSGFLSGPSQKARWVLRSPSVPDLEMQMRSRRAPASADFGDRRAAQNDVSSFDQALRCVCISRHELIAMVYLDHITILRVEVRVDDDPAGGRTDGRSVLGDEVHA